MSNVYALVKVKPNAGLSVDRHRETVEDDKIENFWLAEKLGNYINLRRPNYGTRGAYGNGCATIRNVDKLELLTPWCLLGSPLLLEYNKWVM
jgi:hypothetical protein